jgi:hypothetical protein
MKATIAALSAPLLFAACDDAGAPVIPQTDTVGVADGVGDTAEEYRVDAPACEGLAPVEPLADGRWASRQYVTGLVALPPTGTLTAVTSKMLVLHEVARDGGAITVTNLTCSLTQPRLSGVETVFGPEFISAVPQNAIAATVDGDRVEIEKDRVVLGAELADPAADALPTDAEDPRVRDMDGDTHPGMTVTLQGLFQAQLYITYRHHIGLSGRADAVGCIAGTLEGTREQTQLGASDEALLAFDFSPQPHPDPSINTFVMIPVAAGFDCASLIADEAALFGP